MHDSADAPHLYHVGAINTAELSIELLYREFHNKNSDKIDELRRMYNSKITSITGSKTPESWANTIERIVK
ncbi:hypothetical protein K9L97_05780 [Candidatus Woesearchaeota archaeon]|nr:hypothetical protein [Candidatus Woesearchaeota archaeon]